MQNDIAAMLATPGGVTLGGKAFTLNTTDIADLTNVQSQLGTLLTAAAQTTNPATMMAADQTLHAVQAEILQEINNDPAYRSRPRQRSVPGQYRRHRRRVPEHSGGRR